MNSTWLFIFLFYLSIKTSRWWLQTSRLLVVVVFSDLVPASYLFHSPKNLYLLHDAWKHTVFSYNFTWPLTPSAQMQYDLAAIIHFGLWSRFNEFLLCCMCMSLGLALSFDPHRHQYVLEMHHLALQNKDVEPLQKRSFVLYSVFGFVILKSELLSAQ